MTTATVRLWGTDIGYVSMNQGEVHGRFEYDPKFVAAGIEVAPLVMPVEARRIYRFPELKPRSFHGLAGLLADCLPDRYGNSLIDVWLARTGRRPEEFHAVDRLCATGIRAMGALEFEPTHGIADHPDKQLVVAELVELASLAFAEKETLTTRLDGENLQGPAGEEALLEILRVGTSAGGARAKAVIAFHPKTKEVRSGQLNLAQGFEHWLIKFDGVQFNGDWGVADPAGYGLLEFSYSEVAKACGIQMSECRILEENGRHHFMTRRFDRGPGPEKKFMQTFAALAHLDYYDSGHHSYEQLFLVMRRLGLPQSAIEQQFRRAIFNIVGCNQDDHVKNFAFMMDRRGRWDLSPAYDLCHAEGSAFTSQHQLSLNGKTSAFTRDDLKSLARYADLPRGRDRQVLDEVCEQFANWKNLPSAQCLPNALRKHVERTLRLSW